MESTVLYIIDCGRLYSGSSPEVVLKITVGHRFSGAAEGWMMQSYRIHESPAQYEYESHPGFVRQLRQVLYLTSSLGTHFNLTKSSVRQPSTVDTTSTNFLLQQNCLRKLLRYRLQSSATNSICVCIDGSRFLLKLGFAVGPNASLPGPLTTGPKRNYLAVTRR